MSLQNGKSGKLKLNRKSCDPEIAIQNCVKRHCRECKKKSLGLSSDIANLPDSIILDIGKFNQIFDNLLSNSVKYTNIGRIDIDDDFCNETSTLQVTVSDTGVRMADEVRVAAFDEFYQGFDSMRVAGIGLYTV